MVSWASYLEDPTQPIDSELQDFLWHLTVNTDRMKAELRAAAKAFAALKDLMAHDSPSSV